MARRMMGCLLGFLLMSGASRAQEGYPVFTQDFTQEEFAARRGKIYDAIGESAIAILQGAPSPEGYARFRQYNNFYYLCGIESPHAYLVLDGSTREATVYLAPRDAGRERSEGDTLDADEPDRVKQLSGLDRVYPVERLIADLREHHRAGRTSFFTLFHPPEGVVDTQGMASRVRRDVERDPLDGRLPREQHFINNLAANFPEADLKDLSPTIDRMRLIKSPAEIALIRESSRLSGEATLEAMRSTRPGIYEYELEAIGRFIFHRAGATEAYFPLIPSGPNPWWAHYNANKRQMVDGDLLLMDYAPDYRYYKSDMCRMWPVNGKFTSQQRELYTFYLRYYEAILNRIRPGVTPAQISEEAAEEMREIVEGMEFSKDIYERAARSFVESFARSAPNRRSLGHGTGMAVHDVGTIQGVLEVGMVFTIEPQFRIPEERIYIRLEDMIAITEEGAEILTDFVPREIDAIEAVMREKGMLDK